jgi:para-nitrobenzyl esterase
MKKSNLVITIFCCFNLTIMAQNNNAFAIQTTITNGIVEGNYDTKSSIQTYFGVPFAQPPVGNLRWKAPQPVVNWKGVKETKISPPVPCKNSFGAT